LAAIGAPTATPLGKVWVENLAASLGLIVTPAEVGFGDPDRNCGGGDWGLRQLVGSDP
jgi:hypothetical protein